MKKQELYDSFHSVELCLHISCEMPKKRDVISEERIY